MYDQKPKNQIRQTVSKYKEKVVLIKKWVKEIQETNLITEDCQEGIQQKNSYASLKLEKKLTEITEFTDFNIFI